MNAAGLIASLELPDTAHVGQRVPKKLILENGAPTPADKKYINEGIEELQWVAVLKPTTVGVPEYRDEAREYLEIAILQLTLRAGANTGRLLNLVHRAVPYPVLLFTDKGELTGVSAVHKRWSLGEAGKTVLDGDIVSVEWDDKNGQAFQEGLALSRLPRTTLYALYQGWLDTLYSLQAAQLTGEFVKPVSPEHAAIRREALRECSRLETEIARLRSAAEKEKQLPRKVEINLELNRLQALYADARAKI